MQEMDPEFPSQGQEDPLEKKMATHYSILAGKSHGQRSLGLQRVYIHTHSHAQTMGYYLAINKNERVPFA